MDYNIRTPKGQIRSHTRDIIFGFVLLLGVILASVAVGRALGENAIANWGTWIGAFIAGIAMVASSYALILQSRQAESASWAIALSRLGQLYDQAADDETLSSILVESSDSSSTLPPRAGNRLFNNRQIIWLNSLGLAFEQIYVATNSLSAESKRVWRLYLRNQLNKPSIRAAFVADASSNQDYHQEFWRFVRGTQKSKGGSIHYENYSIHPVYFESRESTLLSSDKASDAECTPLTREDLPFWLEIYKDDEVRKQMYAAPTGSAEELWSYLSHRKVFTVWVEKKCVGGFTITIEKDLLATFGIAIHPEFRGCGYGAKIMGLLESEARKLGLKTLRADVYEDNHPCIRMLNRDGFRRFIWMEKNI
jgi:RimJ/RimL family protein N-acetyltransferase